MRKKIYLLLLIICCILASCYKEEQISKAGWVPSPTYEYNAQTMRGTSKMSIIDKSFITDKRQFYVFHLWGNEEQLGGNKNFKLVASNQETTDEIIIEENVALALDVTGDNLQTVPADRYVLTSISLPKHGLWRFDAFIGNEL
ncbi:hypothetical protein JJQ72_06595 [Paenibacillus sp. F411]|uniref:hypothetical protein n=1 Tax=Paenibacillus sp. F411 TaxID=2820239 RepID=UPI001AAF2ADB|nr:hypothetical protein [Paenibacillus sp. F411]MBO2943646.1 hypothetical protein [Paenibacillus sp. F411]